VLSLIFWSMMLVVTLKYVIIIMRADNKGEGGSLALLALISRSGSTKALDQGRWCCSACSRPRCSTAIR
jgi:KUP system potassium uptake protein